MINTSNVCIKSSVNSFKKSNSGLVKHGFAFVSLISPSTINNVRLLSAAAPSLSDKKLLMKQSYVLLTWFYYFTALAVEKTSTGSSSAVSVFAAPVKKRVFTLTRAPMAHKNWSKEQYKFCYRAFKISFSSHVKEGVALDSLNSGLFFMLIGKSFLPKFETNLLTLKSCSVLANVSDGSFFNFYRFLSSRK